MDDYAGRVLADRYRLPLPSSDEYEPVETRAFDTYSGQEVLVRQVPLPEVVDAEVQGADGRYGDGYGAGAARRPADPALRRAIEAAQAAAQIPDHPRLDQVFDVFAEDGSLWIVSELVMARPLAALLAEQPMAPYRAAEVASDVLTALRVLHAHGWTHRNITERTVLICDDGRVMLTGLAAGAAEEALCGYVVVPPPLGEENDDFGVPGARGRPTTPRPIGRMPRTPARAPRTSAARTCPATSTTTGAGPPALRTRCPVTRTATPTAALTGPPSTPAAPPGLAPTHTSARPPRRRPRRTPPPALDQGAGPARGVVSGGAER